MFKSTDSLSRKRTSTCEGTTTRSISDTITSAPPTELRIRESTAKSSTPLTLHCFRFYRRFARLATHGAAMAPSPKPENFYWVCNQQRKPARRPTRVHAELGHAEYRKTKISSFSSWCQFREPSAATRLDLAWLGRRSRLDRHSCRDQSPVGRPQSCRA